MFRFFIKEFAANMFKRPLHNNGISRARRLTPVKPRISIFQRNFATYKGFNNTNQGYDIKKWLTNRNVIYVGLGIGGFYLYNLDEAPFTHRLRFLWVPYWMERMVGDHGYKQLLYQFRGQLLPSSDPLYLKISSIMNKLLTSALANLPEDRREHISKLKWSIHIIQVDPTKVPPNAFILPNGKIFIFSSILPVCRDADGLATVLSHELSHQLAQHTLEQLSMQPFYIALLAILYSITGTSSLNQMVLAGLLTRPASREMETEADRIGCELMAMLCFNVHRAIDFWTRMSNVEKQSGSFLSDSAFVDFFSTHPNTSKRMRNIETWMPELDQISERSDCHAYKLGIFEQTQRNFFDH